MKRSTIVSLLVLLLVGFGAASCGSDDNNTNAEAPKKSGPAPYVPPKTPTSTSTNLNKEREVSAWSEFKRFVQQGSFRTIQTERERFYYQRLDFNYSQSGKCKEVLSFFQFCYSTTSSYSYQNFSIGGFDREYVRDGNFYDHEHGVNAGDIKNYLNSIVNRTQSSQRIGKASYSIKTPEGYYVIDLNYPLVANPLYFYPTGSDKEGYTYIGYQSM